LPRSRSPSPFINGRLVLGAQSLATFTRIVDEELATAGAKANAQ
jgi:hypothetical protein